jgi:hypothetical protein
MRDTIEMAREAGLLTWLKPPEDVIERFKYFEALVRADEREALQAEVLEQCRINGMGAEREDTLRAELTRLKASIALDKMAENARELGLSYDDAIKGGVGIMLGGKRIDPASIYKDAPPKQDVPETNFGNMAAQPAVQEGRDWSLLTATQESLREHMAEIKRLKAAQAAPVQEPRARLMTYIGKGPYPKPGYTVARTYEECPENQYPDAWEEGEKLYTTPPAPQPVPVKTYHDGKPWPVAPVPNGPYSAPIKELWPVAPKPWVGLTDEEMEDLWAIHSGPPLYRAIEAKLKGKNHG